MAKEKDDTLDIKAMLAEHLKSLKPEELADVLRQSGAVPTMQGIAPDVLQMLAQTSQAGITTAVRETIRQERKENPFYPERSVFNPNGKYDDSGKPLPPKIALKRETRFVGVRMDAESLEPIEVELFNRFTESKTARNGKWTATLENKGMEKERLLVVIPSRTSDERMENSLPLALILQELLQGAESVTQETMLKQITDLQAQVKALQGQPTA